MKTGTPCLLYTQDAEVARRVKGFLGSAADTKLVADPAGLREAVDQNESALLLIDVCGAKALDLLSDLRATHPETLIIALGTPRTEPILEAEAKGVYATEDALSDGRSLEALVRRALDRLSLSDELRVLREKAGTPASSVDVEALLRLRQEPSLPLRNVFQPLRQFGNVEALLQGIIDGIAHAAVVLRAGIFVYDDKTDTYRLKAALGCSEDAHGLVFSRDHALVGWLQNNAQIVSRGGLEHVQRIPERLMLERALSAIGADVLAPLLGRQGIMGWLFFGRRASGLPFDTGDLRDVMIFAEHVSTVLDNARLFEEATFQRTFAETLLHSVPTGIVAAAEDARIRWFNGAAAGILDMVPERVMGQPVEVLGGRLTDCLRRALRGSDTGDTAEEWRDPLTKRHLSVRTSRLTKGDSCLGVVAFVHDQTRERALNRKQRDLERAAFWTDLAASMSHEVRNPLVAIKTFAQLLPERYSDPEFRTEFSSLVSQEVDRLNMIIEQINTFANLPKPVFQPMVVRDAVMKGLKQARKGGAVDKITLETAISDNLPCIRGDEKALVDCFARVIRNCIEALAGCSDPRILVDARRVNAVDGKDGVRITIRDNAGGVEPSIRDNVFSPFCTTKEHSMGLGLPVVQRIVTDHGGQAHLETGSRGTSVTITLPGEETNARTENETPADRG